MTSGACVSCYNRFMVFFPSLPVMTSFLSLVLGGGWIWNLSRWSLSSRSCCSLFLCPLRPQYPMPVTISSREWMNQYRVYATHPKQVHPRTQNHKNWVWIIYHPLYHAFPVTKWWSEGRGKNWENTPKPLPQRIIWCGWLKEVLNKVRINMNASIQSVNPCLSPIPSIFY